MNDLKPLHCPDTAAPTLQVNYDNLFAAMPVGIVLFTPEARVLYANQRAAYLFGKTPEDLPGRHWEQLIHPADRAEFRVQWHDLAANSDQQPLVHRLYHAEKGILYLKLEIVLGHNIVTGLPAYVGYCQDITEQKRLEEEFRHQAEVARRHNEELYTTIAESVPVGLYQNDAEGRCIYVNKQACEILDITFEACLGLGWVNRLHPDDAERMLESWNQAFASKIFWQDEYRFRHRNGRVIWVLAQCNFIW